MSGPVTRLSDDEQDHLSVQPIYARSGPGDLGLFNVSLNFERRKGGVLVASKKVELGQCIGVADALCVGYYTQESRRQVFVSLECQGVNSFLFDFDGTRAKVLYQGGVTGGWYGEGGGRVRAFPTWDNKGHFAIREQFWPKYKLVKGHRVPFSGVVVRTLPIKGGV